MIVYFNTQGNPLQYNMIDATMTDGRNTGMMNKKNTKLLIEYVVASDKYRELWEEYQNIHDTPHQLRMIEAYSAVEVIQEQLLSLMGNNESVLDGLAFIHGIIEGMLGDYIEKYSD